MTRTTGCTLSPPSQNRHAHVSHQTDTVLMLLQELAPEAAIADVEAIERTEWRDAQGNESLMGHSNSPDAVQMTRRRSHALDKV